MRELQGIVLSFTLKAWVRVVKIASMLTLPLGDEMKVEA